MSGYTDKLLPVSKSIQGNSPLEIDWVKSNDNHSIKTDHTFKLSNGRILGYTEYGDSLGFPVFYLHGGQESRLSSIFMDSTAKRLNLFHPTGLGLVSQRTI